MSLVVDRQLFTESKTRTVSGPGISLSSYQFDYRQRARGSQHYF
jgi:hypothetical protein